MLMLTYRIMPASMSMCPSQPEMTLIAETF